LPPALADGNEKRNSDSYDISFSTLNRIVFLESGTFKNMQNEFLGRKAYRFEFKRKAVGFTFNFESEERREGVENLMRNFCTIGFKLIYP